MLLTGLLIGGVSAAFTPALAQTEPTSGGRPSAMLVLDGSGSMWGALGQGSVSKLAASREALRRLLPPLGQRARVGLATFGGGCSGADVLAPPALDGSAEILRPLEKLNPRGKGPLTLGLQQAAKTLPTGAPAALILIHDGPDNCAQDPCAAASELVKANPALKIHVVSLALEKADLQSIACLATATGGRHLAGQDPAGLEQALSSLLDLSSRAAPARAIAEQRPPPEAGTQSATRTDGPPGLALSATLAGSGAPLSDTVHWTLFAADGATLLQREGAALTTELAAGRYVVEARAGLAAARTEIDVANRGLTPARIALDAARIRVTTRQGGSSATPLPALVAIFEAEPGDTSSAGDRLPLWLTRDVEPSIIVAAGRHRRPAPTGTARGARPGEASARQEGRRGLQLGVGRLELSAQSHALGAPPARVLYRVSVDDPDAPGGRREIARTAAPTPVMYLPTGTYYVTATAGAAEARERIAIGPGDTVRRMLALSSARLSVVVSVNGADPAPDQQVVVDVERVGQPSERVARSVQKRPKFVLSEGKYAVTASLGAYNVRTTTQITLAAGDTRELPLRLAAGTLSLRHPAGHHATPPLCETRDERGSVAWRTNQPNPRALLAPGPYRVTCGARRPPLQRTLTIGAGEQHVIDIGQE